MAFTHFPPASWWSTVDRQSATADAAAGVTVAAMLVPQAMAYALLAELPPAVGLAAATVPLLAYALLGTSRQLAVGPVAIVSLMTASALAPIAAVNGTAAAVAAAALLAILVGLVHLGFAAMRAGKLVDRLSHGVLVGFTAAAALIIGVSQGKHLLGVSIERKERVVDTLGELLAGVPEAHGTTVALGAIALVALAVLKRWAQRIPAALVVVVLAIAAERTFDLEAHGVNVVGEIPSTLPTLGLPSFTAGLVGQLATAAVVITLVGFMESIAVAKVQARTHGYAVDPNQELVALGSANVAAGLFGGYPVTGGFSRTAVNDRAGARSPIASVVTAAAVVATIAFFTPLLASLPTVALGAIIISAVVGLIDVAEIRRLGRDARGELAGAIATFAATLALGIEIGLGVAVGASLITGAWPRSTSNPMTPDAGPSRPLTQVSK